MNIQLSGAHLLVSCYDLLAPSDTSALSLNSHVAQNINKEYLLYIFYQADI